VSIEIEPVGGIPEVREGDDLAELIAAALPRGLRDGDVVVVTQKIVSKAEGRVVPEGEGGGREAWVARESVRTVARRGELVVTETRHGFVCANAGVDASNVAEGFLTLLPEDPDASAARIRDGLRERTGAEVAVVITDTFGRPWRMGLVDVAIGVAGMPAVVDLRGQADAEGRILEATIPAFADQVASGAGLVMGKDARVPVAVVRGLTWSAPAGTGRDLIRDPEEDLFRESPLQAIHARRSLRTFGPGEVPREAIEEAVRAACTAPAPHHTRPWLFVSLRSEPARRKLLDAMAAAWQADLLGDGTDAATIDRRLERSEDLLGEAPLLVIPAVRLTGSHSYPDAERAEAEREMFLLSAGAAIQSFLLALHAQGLASCWVSSTLFCKPEALEALGLEAEWLPMGAIAVGRPPADRPPERPPLPLQDHLREA
jgi:coenzyme F420-0:L-glutamate ligase/coenzyme F420-1:gamma-L-glutamate ligase